MTRQEIRVGIVGAGMGGLAAAIGIARAGAHVTVLEGAHELGEVGAGIQVSRSRCEESTPRTDQTDVPECLSTSDQMGRG